MEFDTFLEFFDVITNAPGGISNLRTYILNLAVEGRLVPSNLADENAQVSVDKLISEIPLKVKRTSRYERAVSRPISLSSKETPQKWAETILENLVEMRTGATPSRTNPSFFEGDIPWLVSGDVNNPEIFECAGRISQAALESTNCKLIPPNSVLMALNGQGKTRATVSILRIPATCNQSLLGFTPRDPLVITTEYLFWYLRSKYRVIRDITGQDDRRGLNMIFAAALLIKIPPIELQRRIVEELKILMSHCDRLETLMLKREKIAEKLSRSSLD